MLVFDLTPPYGLQLGFINFSLHMLGWWLPYTLNSKLPAKMTSSTHFSFLFLSTAAAVGTILHAVSTTPTFLFAFWSFLRSSTTNFSTEQNCTTIQWIAATFTFTKQVAFNPFGSTGFTSFHMFKRDYVSLCSHPSLWYASWFYQFSTPYAREIAPFYSKLKIAG